MRPASEGHSITADRPGPYKFNHDWLEGQSSGIFAGGFSSSSAPSISGLVPFQDAEVRRTRFTYPYSWLGASPISGNTHGYNGSNTERKNIEEIKEGERVLFDGDIFENVDNSGGQSGTALTIDIINTSGGVQTGANYGAVITDFTLTNAIIRNSCEGWDIDGSSNPSPATGGGVSLPFQRGLFQNILEYNTTNGNPGCSGVNSVGIAMSSASMQWQGTISGNGTTATFTANCAVQDFSSGSWQPTCMGQVASGSVVTGGTGCVSGGAITMSQPNIAGGLRAAATTQCSGGAISGVTITLPGSGYSSATGTPVSGTGTVSFTLVSAPTAPGRGYAVLDIVPGQPLGITGCQSVTGFNIPTANNGGIVYPTGVGPLAVGGTDPTSLSVSFPSTVSGTDSGGYCTLTGVQGTPQSVAIDHYTFVTNATHTITSNNQNGSYQGGPNFQMNALVRDSILLGGGLNNNPIGVGTPTLKWDYDITSLTAVTSSRPRARRKLSEYGNNSEYSDSAGCTGAGCHPPSTMYYPSTPYCTGVTPTSSCVGFIGAMSATSMPLTLPDYHNFALTGGSSFKAGGADQASDGTDMGVNIAATDAAQTQNVYVCQTNCGVTGPYPDLPNPPITPSFFGEHVNVTTDPFPSISFGAYRNLTGQTDWADIETVSGTYGFTKLNGWLSKAATSGVDAMYTFFRTPAFYSSNPTGTCTGASTGTCYPPTDIAASCTNVNTLNDCDGKTDGTDQHFKNFVTALVADVGTGISFYEGWNEYNQTWAGTTAQLVRMMQDARAIVLAVNPAAKFLNPSVVFTYNPITWATDLTPWTTLMSTSGIDAVSDIINIHGYTLNTSSSLSVAELEVPLVTGVRATLDAADAAKPLWISSLVGGPA